MKFELPEIAWHGTQPIYCCDFQLVTNDSDLRLATGGADNEIKIWKMWCYDGKFKVEVLSILSEHKRSVNCVKFCPVLIQNVPVLASCDDDGVLCLWAKCDDKERYAASFLDEENDLNKEYWRVSRTLRGHIEEVQDLCWNRDGSLLLSGSIDTSARLWNVSTGQCIYAFRESKGLIQGVSIDPLGKFIATFADDKSVRIYHATNKRCAHRNSKFTHNDKSIKLFGDTGDGFFHRITFSPNGEFFMVPSGNYQISPECTIFCTYVYCRDNLSKPVLYLPCGKRPSVAVAFCPIKFKYKNAKSSFNLPYRLVFTVVTENSLIFYDTETFEAFSKVDNIHYASLNSGSWSSDGTIFMATSSDGYATICSFESGELGEQIDEVDIKFNTVEAPHTTPVEDPKDKEVDEDQVDVAVVTQDELSSKSRDITVQLEQVQSKGDKNQISVTVSDPVQDKCDKTKLNELTPVQIGKTAVTDNRATNNEPIKDLVLQTPPRTVMRGLSYSANSKSVNSGKNPELNKTTSSGVKPKKPSLTGKVDSHAKKKSELKSKNQIVNSFARGNRFLAECLKQQKNNPDLAPPLNLPDKPIYIDDDSISEVINPVLTTPLSDKSSAINLQSPINTGSSGPSTPKSILKTPSPESPAVTDSAASGGKKRRVSFKTLGYSEDKGNGHGKCASQSISNEEKSETSTISECDAQNIDSTSSLSVDKKDDSSSKNNSVGSMVGKKRKVPFVTLS